MSPDQKSVFISYRRDASEAHARLIYERLKARGYDVFFDFESLSSGLFENVILNQIASRAHFIIMLGEATLPRCKSPTDLLRREIEQALALRRNIVPVFQSTFDFNKSHRYLPGKMTHLLDYQGVPLTNLSDVFLKATVDTLVEYFENAELVELAASTPEAHAQAVQTAEVVAATPQPTPEKLTAEDYFNRGVEKQEHGDLDGAFTDYTEAIRLDPQFAAAYHNRGKAWHDKGDFDKALEDYDEAIRLNSGLGAAYCSRAEIWKHIRPSQFPWMLQPRVYAFDKAIADYSAAIELSPEYPDIISRRGFVYLTMSKHTFAYDDFQTALKLDPTERFALAGLPIALYALGQIDEAVTRWRALVETDPRYADADWVGKDFDWPPAMIEEARKLIARL